MTDRGERPKQFTRSGVEVPPEPPLKVNSRKGKRLRKSSRFRWENSSGSGTTKGKRRLPRQMIWYAFGVIAFVACAIASSVFLIRGIDPLARMEVVPLKPVLEINPEPLVPVDDPPSEPKDRADAAVKELLAFVNDASHLDRSARVFEKEDTSLKLDTFYGSRGRSLPKRIINPSVTAAEFKGRELLFVSYTDETGRTWSAPFEWDRDRYRLHWEAMTGYGEISWNAFMSERPKGLYRMRLKLYLPDDGLTVSPDGLHLIGLISHPDLAKPVGVLIRKNSPVHKNIEALGQQGDVPVFVGIEWPESGGDSPIISRWFHRDWLR